MLPTWTSTHRHDSRPRAAACAHPSSAREAAVDRLSLLNCLAFKSLSLALALFLYLNSSSRSDVYLRDIYQLGIALSEPRQPLLHANQFLKFRRPIARIERPRNAFENANSNNSNNNKKNNNDDDDYQYYIISLLNISVHVCLTVIAPHHLKLDRFFTM